MDFISGILNSIIGVLTYLISFLPVASIPLNVQNSLLSANGVLAGINMIIPVSVILGALAIFIGIEFAYFTYKVVYWLIKKIPTIS